MQLNGSQIFVEVLCEQGVDTIFGYPGGAVLNLYDELYKNADRITHVLTAHEQGAAHAADGYARATGRTGVVLATSGPGATNLVTGIATAYMDSVPMVAFTGNVVTSGLGKDGFQEAYIAHYQAQFHGAPGGRPGRHHAGRVPHCTERPQGPRAGGYPQGRDRGGLRVYLQKAGAHPHGDHF